MVKSIWRFILSVKRIGKATGDTCLDGIQIRFIWVK